MAANTAKKASLKKSTSKKGKSSKSKPASKASSKPKSGSRAKAKPKSKKSTAKKSSSSKLPYHSLKDFQVTVRDEIRNLHDATESFVRLAVNKAIETDHVEKIEKHVLEIGKNIDELEDMLFRLSLKTK